MMTLGSMLSQAGWTMVPLYVCSFLAGVVALRKALQFWRGQVGSQAALRLVAELEGDRHALKAQLADDPSPLGRVLAATLEAAHDHPASAADHAVRVAMAELEHYDSWLPLLAYIAQVAPLFGLLGTVLGMVDLFSSMQVAGDAVSTTTLSAGIWKALLTTAAGLMIAIPTIGAHRWLVRQLELLHRGDAERTGGDDRGRERSPSGSRRGRGAGDPAIPVVAGSTERQEGGVDDPLRHSLRARLTRAPHPNRGPGEATMDLLSVSPDPEINRLVERTGYAAAALTLLPIPGSEIVGVMPLHVGMVLAIGNRHGRELTREGATELLLQIGTTVGASLLGSRIATTAAKFVLPGLGGVLAAPFMFASTLAIGAVADLWFRNGGEVSDGELKDLYDRTVKRAKSGFDPSRARDPEARRAAEAAASEGQGPPERRDELPMERLRKAKQMLEEGLIDEAEFAEVKRRVLSEI